MGDLFQPWHLMVLSAIFSLIFGAFLILPAIFYILTLQNTLKKCAPASRTLDPGMVWLYIVPVVNIVFHFFIVFAMANSLRNEFTRRGIPLPEPEPGQPIGLAMCISACCCIIPILGFLAALAHLTFWIIYWARIAEYSRALEQPRMTTPMQYM